MNGQSEAPSAPERLVDLVDNLSCKGCYGIEWECHDGVLECKSYYNPKWRLEETASQGLKGLYTTNSTTYTFRVGDGMVGKVFQDKKVVWAPDLQDLTADGVAMSMVGWDSVEFARADLAKQFGIRSAVFVPTEKGVLEFGSKEKAAKLPNFVGGAARGIIDANEGNALVLEWLSVDGKLVPVGHYVPEATVDQELVTSLYAKAKENPKLLKAATDGSVVMADQPHTLASVLGLSAGKAIYWPVPGSAIVVEVALLGAGDGPANACSTGLSSACRLLQAPIALEWRLRGDSLICAGHYNSQERVDKCAKNFGGSRYTLESYNFSFQPGEHVVGRVFKSGVSELIPDLLQLPPSAFKRNELAKKFDVRSAVFLAVKGPDGAVDCVLEICTDHVCHMFEDDIAACKSVPQNVLSELTILASAPPGSIY